MYENGQKELAFKKEIELLNVELDNKKNEIKNYEDIIKRLKFYNGLSNQQTSFSEFVDELKRLEKENQRFKFLIHKFQKEVGCTLQNVNIHQSSERKTEDKTLEIKKVEADQKIIKAATKKQEERYDPLEKLNELIENLNELSDKIQEVFENPEFSSSLKKTKEENLKSKLHIDLELAEKCEINSDSNKGVKSAQNDSFKNVKAIPREKPKIDNALNIISECREYVGKGLSVLLSFLLSIKE